MYSRGRADIDENTYNLDSGALEKAIQSVSDLGELVPKAIAADDLFRLPAFEDLGYTVGDCPDSEKAATEVFSLPVHPYRGERDVEFVAEFLTS